MSILNFFKCKHPFDYLQTVKEQNVSVYDDDFELVKYYFYCAKCGEYLTKSHSRCIGGVDAFLARGKSK